MSSNIDQPADIIVKSDRSGRIRYSAQYKQEVIAAFESSSLSGPVFARQCGIKYPTFASWVAAFRRGEPKAPRNNLPAFLVAEVAADGGSCGLEVRLPGGAVACATDADEIRLLAALLRQLA